MGIGYYGEGASELVHPLFLYECLWNLIGFVLIYGYMDLRKFKGEIFLWYTAWYGLGRGLMEPLRNSEYNLHLFGIRIMMVLAFALCAAALVAIIILRRKSPGYITENTISKKEEEALGYQKQFHINNDTDSPHQASEAEDDNTQDNNEHDSSREDNDGTEN